MMDDNAGVVRAQLVKAHWVWDRVSVILQGENALLKVCGTFYHAVIQSMLLSGIKSWVLSPALLV